MRSMSMPFLGDGQGHLVGSLYAPLPTRYRVRGGVFNIVR